MDKITPCLWFNFNAEEAVNHYIGIFKNSKILETSRYGDAMPELKGKVLTMRFARCQPGRSTWISIPTADTCAIMRRHQTHLQCTCWSRSTPRSRRAPCRAWYEPAE